MISIHRHLKYILFFAIGFFIGQTAFANAYTYDRSPTGSSIDSPVTFTVTADSTDVDTTSQTWQNCLDNGDIGQCFITIYIQGTSDLNADQCFEMTETSQEYIFTVSLPSDFNAGQVNLLFGNESTCNPGTAGFIEAIDSFTINSESTPPTNSIWSGNNGFWGSTTISDVSDGIEASVQATGANTYSLLTFVGIPVLFSIAFYLLFLINKMLLPKPTKNIEKNIEDKPKRKRGRPRKYPLIEHSAADLEFKRNYGQPKDSQST